MGAYDGAEAPRAAPASTAANSRPSRLLLLHSLLLRLVAVVVSILVIAVMVHAKQRVMIFKAEWDNSKAFVALVAISAICLGYSFLQFILSAFHLCSKSWKSPTKCWAWMNFIADQILTYAMLGAAAAAAELAYIAKNGSSRAQWQPICSTFNTFCTRAGASIILSFIAVLALANSSAISAYHLFRRPSSSV
ncbi:CASP-like protein 2U3 [Selaginella moellendorffii]|uniref:CASP-like protein 2U3 n=1 Tax=Selaginella moellendorffii TaxID=88036 RepID=CSPL5_SELML|nr:CASP-like protein 2U3 [Selaginella moellendorffii]D8QNV6.2 RecName: Full=CASP-like protein 2U3; Short=SmCASPL2U3 [Selaginella moellendorffii]|eukprot:XP_002960637.2 CASP-like protein 2U3 [Selaginella moellendorffii]